MRLLLAVALVALCPLASPPEPQQLPECGAYRTHLLRARALLSRGDRARALDELRDAKAALRSCREHRDQRAVARTFVGIRAPDGTPVA